MSPRINRDHFAALIAVEISELKRLSNGSKHSRAPVTLDQQSVGRLSRMDAMQQQSMELATEERRQQRLKMLQSAQQRLNSDNFGYCLKCDDEIAPARLEIDPATTLCILCA
jgi:DnaK suppressor protein